MAEHDERLALIYGESVRKLDQQAAGLEALRGRTGLLLGAGSISTSFLAPTGIAANGFGWQAWTGTLLLVVAAAVCGAILWPYGGWVFSHKPKQLLRVYVDEKPRTIDGMHRWLAVENEDYFEENRSKIGRLHLLFQLAMLALGVSLACWLALLVR